MLIYMRKRKINKGEDPSNCVGKFNEIESEQNLSKLNCFFMVGKFNCFFIYYFNRLYNISPKKDLP